MRLRDRAVWEQMTKNNTPTRQKFDATVGNEWVLVVDKEGGIEFSGKVVAFLPEERLSVLDESGRMATVNLERVRPDMYKWYE